MEKATIEHIQSLTLAAIAHQKTNAAGVPIALVPHDFKIEALEKYQLAPTRHLERFKTKYLSEFFAYAKQQPANDLTVFVSEKPMSAKAIFDRSAPEAPSWQDHTAILELENTPALDALLALNNRSVSQNDIIDFAQDWKANIMFFDGDTELTFNDAISRLRKLKISKSSSAESNRGDFKASASALEQIEIDAAGAPLPSHFLFITEPYLQFNERSYHAQLRALSDDNKPQLKYRLMGMPALEQDIADEFKSWIKADLERATIYIGSI